MKMFDGMIVTRSVSIKSDEDSATKHTRKWGFDFTGCTPEQVAGLATRELVIKVQGQFRKSPEGFNATEQTFKVLDLLGRAAPVRSTTPTMDALAAIGITVATESEAIAVMERAKSAIAKAAAR